MKTQPALGEAAFRERHTKPPGRGRDSGSTEGKCGGNISCAGAQRALPAERVCAGHPYPMKRGLCHWGWADFPRMQTGIWKDSVGEAI